MRRMSSILAVALLAVAAPTIFAADTMGDAAAAVTTAVQGGTATLDLSSGKPVVTNQVPTDAVVINLTPGAKGGCYTIGEPENKMAEFCKDANAPVEKATIDGMDYEWVTGTLTNTGKADLCHFSAAPLPLAAPLPDAIKIVPNEQSAQFQQLTLPESKLQELKLPQHQAVTAQLLLPTDVSKITAETPLAIPGASLSANLQPCALIDGLQAPVDIKAFSDSLSKLAAPMASPEAATKAAGDAAAAVAGAATDAADATTKAAQDAAAAAADATAKAGEAATDAAVTATDAAAAATDAAAKAGEAVMPQATETEAISPAHSLTASLAGIAAVAAALAFQFVL